MVTKASISCPTTGDEIKYQFSVPRFLLKVTFPEEVPFTINEVPFIVATLPEVTSKLLIDKLPVSVTSDVMYALLEELALEIFLGFQSPSYLYSF